MNLTERERVILQLAKQRLSDNKIARKMSKDPPNVTCSRKNAQKKLVGAIIASRMGVDPIISVATTESWYIGAISLLEASVVNCALFQAECAF